MLVLSYKKKTIIAIRDNSKAFTPLLFSLLSCKAKRGSTINSSPIALIRVSVKLALSINNDLKKLLRKIIVTINAIETILIVLLLFSTPYKTTQSEDNKSNLYRIEKRPREKIIDSRKNTIIKPTANINL